MKRTIVLRIGLILFLSINAFGSNTKQVKENTNKDSYGSCLMLDFDATTLRAILKLKKIDEQKLSKVQKENIKSNDKEFIFLSGLNSLSPRMYNALVISASVSEKELSVEEFATIMNNDKLFSLLTLSPLGQAQYKVLIEKIGILLSSEKTNKREKIIQLVEQYTERIKE